MLSVVGFAMSELKVYKRREPVSKGYAMEAEEGQKQSFWAPETPTKPRSRRPLKPYVRRQFKNKPRHCSLISDSQVEDSTGFSMCSAATSFSEENKRLHNPIAGVIGDTNLASNGLSICSTATSLSEENKGLNDSISALPTKENVQNCSGKRDTNLGSVGLDLNKSVWKSEAFAGSCFMEGFEAYLAAEQVTINGEEFLNMKIATPPTPQSLSPNETNNKGTFKKMDTCFIPVVQSHVGEETLQEPVEDMLPGLKQQSGNSMSQYDQKTQEHFRPESVVYHTENEHRKFKAANCIVGSELPTTSSVPHTKNNLKRRPDGGTDLNKRPQKRLKKKVHRPKIVGIGKPRRTLEPKTPKKAAPKRAPSKPKTSKPKTPKPATSKKNIHRANLNIEMEKHSNDESAILLVTHPQGLGTGCRKLDSKGSDHIQTDFQYNALQAYQGTFHANQCLNYSRNIGLDFPKMCRKQRMRRRKWEVHRWSRIASELYENASHDTLRHTNNKNQGRLPYQTTKTRDLIDELQSLIKTKKKRSKGYAQRRDLAGITTTTICNQSPRIYLKETVGENFQMPDLNGDALFANENVGSLTEKWTKLRPSLVSTELQTGELLRKTVGVRQKIENFQRLDLNEDALFENEKGERLTEKWTEIRPSLVSIELHNGELIRETVVHEMQKIENFQRPDLNEKWTEIGPSLVNTNLHNGQSEGSPLEHEGPCFTNSREYKEGRVEERLPEIFNNNKTDKSIDSWGDTISLAVQKSPHINHRGNHLEQDQYAHVPSNGHGILVSYQGPKHHQSKKKKKKGQQHQDAHGPHGGIGILTKYKGRKKPKELSPEHEELALSWRLQLKDTVNERQGKEDDEEWWKNEREVFRGRIGLLISRMHIIQGNRQFSPWKGSVVDSIVGVFLTQNVSDHLSSSAFMSLAAKFPLQANQNSSNIISIVPISDEESSSDKPNDLEGGCSIVLYNPKVEQKISSKVDSVGMCNLPPKICMQPPNDANNLNQKKQSGKNKKAIMKAKTDWDCLRRIYSRKGERNRNHMDSVDWEAVRQAKEKVIADTIKGRGQHNIIAGRLKKFLNQVHEDHKQIDLEWLRNTPPETVTKYLREIEGIGLKSIECVRLLALQHVAFPVDVNVGRIAIRLGWVPIQPLPEDLQIHLLQLMPVLDNIQKYLWPRLQTLDPLTLYELHYQMITFGKVYCTKKSPNCNSCPMKGECRHYASAFASARLALPGPTKKPSSTKKGEGSSDAIVAFEALSRISQSFHEAKPSEYQTKTCEPIIEEPSSPQPEFTELPDIEDLFLDDPNTIPTFQLNGEKLLATLEPYISSPQPESTELPSTELPDIEDLCLNDHKDISTIQPSSEKFLETLEPYMNVFRANGLLDVLFSSGDNSIPVPKLKHVGRLRTKHLVYVLPDDHPLLAASQLDRRDAEDPCQYLLAIWTSDETANSSLPPKQKCNSQESRELCNYENTCFSCNNLPEEASNRIRGTILIPCRTAMKGSFPLNGTYFQVNEVFADHESSRHPINVPREWLWRLKRRVAYFGSSTTSILKGLSTLEIMECFWRGFICVRAFDRRTRNPKRLQKRFHIPTGMAGKKGKHKEDDDE